MLDKVALQVGLLFKFCRAEWKQEGVTVFKNSHTWRSYHLVSDKDFMWEALLSGSEWIRWNCKGSPNLSVDDVSSWMNDGEGLIGDG